jgi:hypothetical protein
MLRAAGSRMSAHKVVIRFRAKQRNTMQRHKCQKRRISAVFAALSDAMKRENGGDGVRRTFQKIVIFQHVIWNKAEFCSHTRSHT